MLECFEHPCNTKCCYLPFVPYLVCSAHAEESHCGGVCLPHNERVFTASLLSEISFVSFHFVRKLWRWWGGALNSIVQSREMGPPLQEFIYWRSSVPAGPCLSVLLCLFFSLRWGQSWAQPGLSLSSVFHMLYKNTLHYFACLKSLNLQSILFSFGFGNKLLNI